MNTFLHYVTLFVSSLLASSQLFAQSSTPRFVLPAKPYDYTSIHTASGVIRPPTLRERDKIRRVLFCRCQVPSIASPFEIKDDAATLGRVLFYDPWLSRNKSRSCASCHQQARAFADSRALSRGFRRQKTRRNSMALVNVAFQGLGFFWDGRTNTLEEMVLQPIQDPIEMGLDLPTLVGRLQSDADYRALFLKAFGDSEVTAERVGVALAAFVRSMVTFRSKFDIGRATVELVTDEFFNFSVSENRGKQVFFESCATCHCSGTLLGWVAGERVLLFQRRGFVNNGVDGGMKGDDVGRAGVTEQPSDTGKFRAPSLRNIELTGPYMHDGRFKTLEQVVNFYVNRVRPHDQLDRRLDSSSGYRSGSARRWGDPAFATTIQGPLLGLDVSGRERRDLVAFLKTLTDSEFVKDPRFSDPFRSRDR